MIVRNLICQRVCCVLHFPYILLISLTALAGGILNTFERFLIPALTPVLLNLSLIAAAALLLADRSGMVPVTALAWGVLIAGFAQLFLQIPALMRLGLITKATLGLAAQLALGRIIETDDSYFVRIIGCTDKFTD